MNYDLQDEVLDALTGHEIVGFGRDPIDMTMYHLILDDGRRLVFVGLGILLPTDHALH